MTFSRRVRTQIFVALMMALGALASGLAGQLQAWWYLATAVSALAATATGIGTFRQMRIESAFQPIARAPSGPIAIARKLWNIPQSTAGFVGRKDDIKILKSRGSRRGVSIIALHGLGGIGKSQLALKYASNEINNLKIGWMINAAKRDYILEGLSRLGESLLLPRRETLMEDAQQALEELGRRQHWLLIYDDAINQIELQGLLPNSGSGLIIVTSRFSNWSGTVRAHEVEPLDLESSSQLLISGTPYKDRKDAEQIALRLGGLPLALDQAAAYCRNTGVDFAGYLRRYERAAVHLLNKGTPPDYDKPVAGTWTVNLQEVRRRNPAAIELLGALAYIAPAPLPRDVLTEFFKPSHRRLPKIIFEPLAVDDSIAILREMSLVTLSASNIHLHALLQLVMMDQIRQGRILKRHWYQFDILRSNVAEQRSVTAAVKMLATAFPKPRQVGGQTDQWERCAVLRPHAEAVLDHAARVAVDPLATATLQYWLAYYLNDRGEYEATQELYENAIAARRRVLGDEHPDTLDAMNNLISCLIRARKLTQARALGEEVLTNRRRILGDDDPETLITTNNLARALYLAGEIEAARILLKKAVSGFLRIRGLDHQNTLAAMTNLALVFSAQGQSDEARDLHEKVLIAKRRSLGPADPDTLRSMYHVACIRHNDGKLAEASSMLEECIALQNAVLGARHRDTIQSIQKLAEWKSC